MNEFGDTLATAGGRSKGEKKCDCGELAIYAKWEGPTEWIYDIKDGDYNLISDEPLDDGQWMYYCEECGKPLFEN